MTVKFDPGDAEHHRSLYADDPSMQDLDTMIGMQRHRKWFNFVVEGTPKKISPEWLAKHPGWLENEYEYAVSYSIWHEDLYDMMESDDPLSAFNYYLEGTGKEWLELSRVRIVDRTDPWENTM